jgi:hypothetical protein
MKQLCMIVLVFVCSGVSSAQDTISQNQTQKEFVKLKEMPISLPLFL